MSEITLIHLVSEQTMQNVLPTLALRPKRIVQVRSRESKFNKSVESLINAINTICNTEKYRNFRPEFCEAVIDSDSPSAEETEALIRSLLPQFPPAVMNITGGTKLMSLGAWRATADHCPVLYCDTAKRRFIKVGSIPLPPVPPFEQIATSLTVAAVMAAHGVAPDNWRFDRPTEALRKVGRVAFDCWKTDEQAFRGFAEAIRIHFRNEGERIPSGLRKLKELVEQPLPVAPPPVQPFLQAISDAGLLSNRDGSFYPSVEARRDHVERLANLIGGSWLELFIIDLLLNQPHLWTDPHWSVEPKRAEEVAFGETDVICVNVPAAALHIISCKTSLRQPLETLEALAQRRHDLGGTFAKATLAVLSVRENERAKLKNWAKLLNVKLLIGDEIVSNYLQ